MNIYAKNDANVNQKGTKHEPKGDQNAWTNRPSEKVAKIIEKSDEKGAAPPPWATVFGSHFGSKIDKNSIQQIIKKTIAKKHGIWCQKGAKREPTSMPKRIKNQCKNWSRKRRGKSWKIMLFWHGKSSESVELYHAKRGLAISVREQEKSSTNIKHDAKIHPKIYEHSIQKSFSK